MPFRGEIWESQDNEDKKYFVFVCGVQEPWIWYTHIKDRWRLSDDSPAWIRGRIEPFEKKFRFTKHVIASKAYWKKKATGDLVQIVGVKDDGWKKIYVFYDLNKIDIHNFFEYFEPANKTEVLQSVAKEKSITKNEKRMKRRIAMKQGKIWEPGEAME